MTNLELSELLQETRANLERLHQHSTQDSDYHFINGGLSVVRIFEEALERDVLRYVLLRGIDEQGV